LHRFHPMKNLEFFINFTPKAAKANSGQEWIRGL